METRGENCTTTESTFITLVNYFLLNDLNRITLFDPMPVRFIIKDLDKSFQQLTDFTLYFAFIFLYYLMVM